jgi:aarF domain-containing kinase
MDIPLIRVLAVGSPVNRINIFAHYAALGLVSNVPSSTAHLSFTERAHSFFEARYTSFRFRLTLFAIDAAFHLTNIYALLKSIRNRLPWIGDPNARPKGGFEDELEESMKRMAKSEFGVELGDAAFEG